MGREPGRQGLVDVGDLEGGVGDVVVGGVLAGGVDGGGPVFGAVDAEVGGGGGEVEGDGAGAGEEVEGDGGRRGVAEGFGDDGAEEGFGLGTVTTPDCAVDQIVRITSKHSGFDVAYIVSFDTGETWWTYNNGWTEPDYTQDVYGMFEVTMRSITPEQWAEKLTGTIMVRAVLIENASLTDIQIYTEVYQ